MSSLLLTLPCSAPTLTCTVQAASAPPLYERRGRRHPPTMPSRLNTISRSTLLVGLWAPAPEQTITSARTSGPRVAALLVSAPLASGTLNADLGGGAYDVGTTYLAERGITNVIYDPFNRAAAHNEWAVATICAGQAHSVTVANVLNVIREATARLRVIQQAADALGRAPGRCAYFSVYYDRQRAPGLTIYGWQEHRPLASYVPELQLVFHDVTQRGGMLIARQPRVSRRRASQRP